VRERGGQRERERGESERGKDRERGEGRRGGDGGNVVGVERDMRENERVKI